MPSFNDILGYEKQVAKLKSICDYLKNTQRYEDFGAHIPQGVLISGEGGVGKTLFAEVLAQESQRNIYVPQGKGKRAISKALKKAVKDVPSVFLLDDLDFYPDEMYDLLVDLFTDIYGDDVFVIATATNVENLPESLLQNIVFEERLVLDVPNFADSKLIFNKYFSDKKVAEDFNLEDFCYIAQNCSVSTVDDIYNDASIYAVRDRAEKVTMDHLFKAAMAFENHTVSCEFNESIAFHESGHAIVDLLLDGIAAYIVLNDDDSGFDVKKTRGIKSYKDRQRDYIQSFAGNACEEFFMGESAIGGYIDLGRVSQNIERDNKYLACQGFEYYDSTELNSPAFNDALAKKVQTDMQSYYDSARKMVEDNKPLVLALVEALRKRNYLLHSEIHKIYDEYLKSKK